MISYSSALQGRGLESGCRHRERPPAYEGQLAMAKALDMALAVFDAAGRLVEANRLFDQLAQSVFVAGTWRFAAPNLCASLPELYESARSEGYATAVVAGGHGGVVVKVFGDADNPAAPWYFVSLLPVGTSRLLSEGALMRLFALTPREAEIARQVGEGKSAVEIARAKNVSQGTVRSQLKAVFRKVGANSQCELAAMIRY